MSPADIDQWLRRLRTAADRIGTDLVELEGDPGRALVEAAALEGTSASCRDEVRTTLAALFERYALLVDVQEWAMTRCAALAPGCPTIASSSCPPCSKGRR